MIVLSLWSLCQVGAGWKGTFASFTGLMKNFWTFVYFHCCLGIQLGCAWTAFLCACIRFRGYMRTLKSSIEEGIEPGQIVLVLQ